MSRAACWFAVFVTGIALLWCAMPTEAQKVNEKPPPAGYKYSPTDQLLASWVLAEQSYEIELAKYALQRTEDATVREFSDRVQVADREYIRKLRPFAVDKVEAAPADQIDVIALKQQLAAKSLETARRELEQRQGRDFDRLFLQMQVFVHLEQINTFHVFADQASAELQIVLTEGRRLAENHLAKARDVEQRLAAESRQGAQ